jgi:Protein of unknown function (DUF3987)
MSIIGLAESIKQRGGNGGTGDAAAAAACPLDYVAAPLLAAASTLIGHARWVRGGETWTEPPHLWCGSVGDSGDGKSPGADVIHRDVLPELDEEW